MTPRGADPAAASRPTPPPLATVLGRTTAKSALQIKIFQIKNALRNVSTA
jgi:hypothetical protein